MTVHDLDLLRFAHGLACARKNLGPDITAQRLLILLEVYLHQGLSQAELLRELPATSITALSRNLAELSTLTPKKTVGLGLVELRQDPLSLRRKLVFLTPKGRRFVARLRKELAKTSAA